MGRASRHDFGPFLELKTIFESGFEAVKSSSKEDQPKRSASEPPARYAELTQEWIPGKKRRKTPDFRRDGSSSIDFRASKWEENLLEHLRKSYVEALNQGVSALARR